MIHFKKATLADISLMQELVRGEVEKRVILPRTDDEVATTIRSYTLVFDDANLVGYSALHIHSVELAEVRSLVVRESVRGRGVGGALVRELLKEGRALGAKRIFTLTYRKSFFEKLGFCEICKSELPSQKIWADCIKCKRFPNCDETALILDL